MQQAVCATELEFAIKSLEKLLNSNEDKFVLDTIKHYKQHKTIDENTICKLKTTLLNDKLVINK